MGFRMLGCLELATLATGLVVTLHAPVPAPSPPPPAQIVAPMVVAPSPLPAPAPRAQLGTRPRVVARVVPLHRLTPRERMWVAIHRLPGYRPGIAHWVLADHGHWGLVNLRTSTIYLSPWIPRARWYDVVAHEWSHVLSLRPYPNRWTAFAALTAFYGPGGFERAADCMARQLGARWTNYTRCTNARWRWAARQLLAGHRV